MAIDRTKIEAVISVEDLASQSLSMISGELAGMAGRFAGLGLAIGGGIAALTAITKAADEDEQQWRVLGAAIESAKGDVSRLIPVYQQLTDALEEQTGVADTVISAAFTQMTRALIPLETQQWLMNVALDAAADSGRNLGGVIDALVKGYAGQTMQLNRMAAEFGIATKEGESFVDVVSQISDRVAGAASAQMQGLSGSVRGLSVEWDRLLETTGKPFVGITTDFLHYLGIAIDELKGKIPTVSEEMRNIQYEIESLQEKQKTWGPTTKPYKDMQLEIDALTASLGALQLTEQMHRDQQAASAAVLERSKNLWREFAIEVEIADDSFVAAVPGMEKYTGSVNKLSDGLPDVIANIRELGVSIEGSFSGVGDEPINVLDRIREHSATTARGMKNEWQDSTSHMIGMFGNLRNFMRGNDEDMFFDFVQYFLLPMIPAVGGVVGGIVQLFKMFDVPENDRMLIEEGRRIPYLIAQGVNESWNAVGPLMANNVIGGVTMAGGGGTSVVVHINGSVADEDFVYRKLVPAIERAVANGNSSLVRKELPTGRRLGQ